MTRLLCDEMLIRLGRWLRSAGYDTAIARHRTDDCSLLAWALAEDRFIVTRDRALAERRHAAGRVIVLAGADVAAQARELAWRCGIDWLHRPFTRCLVDNSVLQTASRRSAETIPVRARDCGGPYLMCPDCGRLYWQGSHHRRMWAQLAAWRAQSEQASSSTGLPASRVPLPSASRNS